MDLGLSNLRAELRRAGVHVEADGERIHYRALRGALTPELRAAIASAKAGLLAALRREQDSEPPVITVRPLLRSPSGVEVIELDSPDGRRWEKRATRGALALVIETTRDLAEARRWVETIRGYMEDGKRHENHPEGGSAA